MKTKCKRVCVVFGLLLCTVFSDPTRAQNLEKVSKQKTWNGEVKNAAVTDARGSHQARNQPLIRNTNLRGNALSTGSDVVVGGGTTMVLTNGVRLLVGGNLLSSGTLSSAGGSHVYMNGSGDQMLSGVAALETLTVCNEGTLTLGSSTAINGKLVLTSGEVMLGSYNLTLGSTATIVGAAVGRSIITNGTGKVHRAIAAGESFQFPVAPVASAYNPITIALKAGDPPETFSVNVADGVAHISPDIDTSLCVNRTWNVSEQTPGGNHARLSFQWNEDEDGSNAVPAYSSVYHYAGSRYYQTDSLVTPNTPPTFLGTANGYYAENFSTFIVGLTDGVPSKHTITATASANGAIAPSGSMRVIYDASQSFTITPDIGYRIDSVKVDGVNFGAITGYLFTNVVVDHVIAAYFSDGVPPVIALQPIDNTSIDNDFFVKNGDNLIISATITDNNPLSAASIACNLNAFYGGSGHSTDHPDSYIANVATWTLTGVQCVPANGTIALTISATDISANVSNVPVSIIADNLAPTPPASFTSSIGTTGGQGNVSLQWTAGTDDHYKGVVICYNTWAYPLFSGTQPPNPVTPLQGTPVPANPILAPAVSCTHTVADRNVYLYSIFAVDSAGNYSSYSATGGRDCSVNYYLGDVGSGAGTFIPGSGGYDGRVNFDDLIWFSRLYFASSPSWLTIDPRAMEMDIGPTVANNSFPAGHPRGTPHPDGMIGFEDLMIFSLNYNVVQPKVVPANRTLADRFALELHTMHEQSSRGKFLTATLRLANNGKFVNGISLKLKFDAAVLSLVSVTRGDLLPTEESMLLHREEHGVFMLDAAVLGKDRGIDYSGDIAVLRFAVNGNAQNGLQTEHVSVRNAENHEEAIEILASEEEAAKTFALYQNYPNPFNPTTTIKFSVETTGPTRLELYNILGQRVVTLYDDVAEAGHYYNIQVDASNFATGIYLYRLQSGKKSDVKKLVLLK